MIRLSIKESQSNVQALLFFLVLIFAPMISFGKDIPIDTVSNVPGIKVSTSVDKAEAYIGDLITYLVSIEYDSTYELVPPPLGANLGAFDVKDYEPDIVTQLEGGRVRSETLFKLTTFTTGDYIIPPMPLLFILPDSSRKLVLADGLPIKILSMLADSTDSLDIRPLKAPYEFEKKVSGWYYIAGAGLLLLLLGLLLWLYLRKKRTQLQEVDLRDPWEIAFERLALLKTKELPLHESHKLYYIELTEIVRDYLGRIYEVDTLEMTTDEFALAFREGTLPEDLYVDTLEFLKHADLVKFARFEPERERTEDDFKFVHNLVEVIRVDYLRRKETEATETSSLSTGKGV